jgi:hypothetical protein
MVLADRGKNLVRESVRVRLPSGLTRHLFGDCNADQGNGEKVETQAFKAGSVAGLCGTCDIDGRAKSAQHGHRIRRLGRCSARATGRQALLTAKRDPLV